LVFLGAWLNSDWSLCLVVPPTLCVPIYPNPSRSPPPRREVEERERERGDTPNCQPRGRRERLWWWWLRLLADYEPQSHPALLQPIRCITTRVAVAIYRGGNWSVFFSTCSALKKKSMRRQFH
jgi:hypothetical protein